MPREIYDTSTLLEVMEEQDSPANYWLDLLFPNELRFDDEWVDFEKIPRAGRKLAPFVAPLAQGRPIYEEASTVGRFKPAYVKPKDPVTPTRVIARRPGEILAKDPQSPEQRRDAIIADITAYHRAAIERRWEWLAAQAALYGAVTIAGDDYPARVVDYGRAAGHSITLGTGARWGDSGVSIFDNIQTWMELMQMAPFGGAPTRLTMGTLAWAQLRKSAEVKDFLDTTFRGNNDVNIQRGRTRPGEVRFVGSLGVGLDVYVYSDYYTVNGVSTPFMDPRDVLLSGPNVDGYRCFAAILDPYADFQPLPVYPRNWINNDPPVEYVMSQSAPLMVPVNPNATLRARVVA